VDSKNPASAVFEIMKAVDESPRAFFDVESIKAAGGLDKLCGKQEEKWKSQYQSIKKMMEGFKPSESLVFLGGRKMGKSVMSRLMTEELQGSMRKSIMDDMLGKESMTTAATSSSTITFEEIEKVMANLNPKKRNNEEIDKEAAMKEAKKTLSPEAVAALENLAQIMTERLGGMPKPDRRVTLSGPMSVTVMRKAGFGKRNHIGGEEFVMEEVYVGSGKLGHRLIFRMRPTAVSDYDYIELPQGDCESSLNHWRQVADHAAGGNFYVELEKVRTIDFAKLQEIENQRLSSEYQEFGAW
jgi:hypothetical protein